MVLAWSSASSTRRARPPVGCGRPLVDAIDLHMCVVEKLADAFEVGVLETDRGTAVRAEVLGAWDEFGVEARSA